MSRNILDFHEIVVYTLKSVVEVAGYKVLHCFGEHLVVKVAQLS